MAFRGRGRGRGRGGGNMARVTDEQGNLMSTATVGPPPLFPEGVELPEVPELEPRDSRLLERWHDLKTVWENSAYHLKAARPKQGGMAADIANFKASGLQLLDGPALTSVMTLHPHYFPEELYTTKDAKASSKAASSRTQQSYWAEEKRRAADRDTSLLDRLAKMESQAGSRPRAADADEGDPNKKGDGEGNEEDVALQEEEEDEYPEEDDYYQGQEYDDDEEYLNDADEPDEGPTY